MIDVVLGPDDLLARQAVRTILDRHDPDGQNTSHFDAQRDPLDSLVKALATPAFFGAARVVVGTGYLAAMKGTGPRRSRAGKSPGRDDAFASLMTLAAGDQVLVLHDPDLAALPAGLSSVLPSSATVASHHAPRGSELIDFTQHTAAGRGATIDRQSAQKLLDALFPVHWRQPASNPAFDRPPDTATLLSEIEKLATATGNGQITEELIEQLTPAATADRLFPLLDAMVAGNPSQALRELASLPRSTDERMRLLAQLYQQIEYAAAAATPGRPSDPLAAGKALGMTNPNRMKAILRAAGGTRRPASESLQFALHADRRLKRGYDADPADAVYRLIAGSRPRSTSKN
jgi:hypothetical protein